MAVINPRENAYRNMLINLNKLITDQELSAMKFKCKAARIGDRNRDKIESSLDLWEKLEERGFLGANNLDFLKDLLKSCTDNRRDVIDVVLQFEKSQFINALPGQEDLGKEIDFLEDNLGSDWKFFIRALGLPEPKLELCIESHPRNVKEQMHMAFTCLNGLKKEDILRALKDVHRNDLYYKLSQGLP